MTVYLICFRSPAGEKAHYKHAGHYLGFTDRDSVDSRLREHRGGYGAALTRAAIGAGLELELARTWPGGTKDDEWHLRCRAENPRLCPICNPESAHRLAAEVGHA